MASLKDFIPDAQFHESNGDFEKAIEVYTKGIDSLQNDTSNTWRLYWSRAGLKIKLAQGIFEKAGKSTETEWEVQHKFYTEAEYDLKQAIKGQESNARKGFYSKTEGFFAFGFSAFGIKSKECFWD